MNMPSVGYCFGVFVGGGALPLLLDEPNNDSGAGKPSSDDSFIPWSTNLRFPTIHAAGRRDSFATQGIRLKNWIEGQQRAISISFEGEHEMPKRKEDVLHLANEILKMYEESLEHRGGRR
jgi:hypothetical protein